MRKQNIKKSTQQLLFNLTVLLLVLLIISLTISGRGCSKRNVTRGGGSGGWIRLTPPSNLSAIAISPYQINLTWEYAYSTAIDGFAIERRTITTGYSPLATVGPNVLSYSDTGLIPSTTYYYRIQAFNITPGDRSDWCTEARTTTLSIFQQGLWSKVAAGRSHTLAMRTDGTVWSWGQDDVGQLGLGDTTYINRLIPSLIESDINWETFDNVSSIASGLTHSVAIKTDATLWVWGSNGSGQLGQGDNFSSDYPIPVGIGSDWVAVAAGFAHTVGLKSNGTLWAWGYNNNGQLGLSDTITRTTPTLVTTELDWSILDAGDSHNLCLKNTGTLWAWGNNLFGQLGLGDTTDRTSPRRVGSETNWIALAVGKSHSIGIKSNKTLWTWGRNQDGQLGLGNSGTGTDRTTPTQVGADTDWTAIATARVDLSGNGGGCHTLGLKSNGTLWAWGANSNGELGIGNTISKTNPTLVTTESDWLVVAAGAAHTIGIKSNKTIWAWGYNYYGQLGLGDTINRNIPCLLGIPAAPSSLIATIISSSQIDLSWNDNSIGEDGFEIELKISSADYALLTTVGANVNSYSDIFSLLPGTYYSYRIRAYNNIGNSLYSNVACTALSGNWLAVAAGFAHTVGLKSNGTLWAWGQNDSGQLGLGNTISRTTPTLVTTESDWLMVTTGNDYTLGLKSNKTLWAWGLNTDGQLGLGDSGNGTNRYTPTRIDMNSNWVTVIAGTSHSLGLKTDKTLWAWGYNNYGQLGLGDTITRTTPTLVTTESDWLALAAGNGHTLGLKTDKTLWAWGFNSNGQLGLGGTISRTAPAKVTTGIDWSILATADDSHSLGLKTNNTLWAWGRNNSGQLGLGDITNRDTPTQVTTEMDWSIIAAGSNGGLENYSLALKINRTLWAWGKNNAGQLGLGEPSSKDTKTPTQVTTEIDWSIIVANNGHSLGLKTNRTLWAWGKNDTGQLGLGDLINRNTPTMMVE